MKLKITAVVLVVMLLLSSCSMGVMTMDELISPPKAYGENVGIQSALDKKLDTGYVLKSPSAGKYDSAFVLYDVNNDGMDEAFAFYQPASTKNQVNMMLLVYDTEKKQWYAVEEVEGQGSGVYSVDFGDFNDDGIDEICIGWLMFNNKEKRILSVYSFDSQKGNLKNIASSNITFTSMVVCNMNEDNRDEILLLSLEAKKSPSEATAKLYGEDSEGNFNLISEAHLDPTVTSYPNVVVQKRMIDTGAIVYVDGTKGEEYMVTELVYWDKDRKSLVAPLYNTMFDSSSFISRGMRVYSRDVNDDGIVEVAMPGTYQGETDKNIMFVDWNVVNASELVSVQHSVINKNDSFMLDISDELAGKLCVVYNSEKRATTFYEWDFTNNIKGNELFTIVAMKKSEWDNTQGSTYDKIGSNGSVVYLAKMYDNTSGTKISVNDLKYSIRNYN